MRPSTASDRAGKGILSSPPSRRLAVRKRQKNPAFQASERPEVDSMRERCGRARKVRMGFPLFKINEETTMLHHNQISRWSIKTRHAYRTTYNIHAFFRTHMPFAPRFALACCRMLNIIHTSVDAHDASNSPLACLSMSSSLLRRSRTTLLLVESSRLLALCPSSDWRSSTSSGVGSMGYAFVICTSCCSISEFVLPLMSNDSTLSTGSCCPVLEPCAVLLTGAGDDVAEVEV